MLLKAGQTIKPDRVVVLGDFLDCAPVSSHSKDLSRLQRFKKEILCARAALKELKTLGAEKHDFVEGNHEYRLPRYLQEKAPELADLDELTIPNLLQLDGGGWNYVPYREFHKVGKLHVTHETGKAGATAHVSAMNDFQDNVVIGHTHRMGVSYAGNAKGHPHVGAMFGWLGDKSKVDYMHKIKANRDWMLGFGVGYLEPNGIIHLQAVPIINYKVVVEGKLVTA